MLNAGPLNSHTLNGTPITEYSFEISAPLVIALRGWNPSRRWSVPSSRIAQTIYICTLDDIRLPMSSFQARLRDGQPTYFGAVVPMTDGVVEGIQARTGGTLALYSGIITASGDEILEQMTVTTLHSLRYDKGARSGSITVVGYVTETTTTSKVVDLTGISTEGLQADGKRTVRCEPSLFLRPGDVVRWSGQQMIVGMIALTVNPRSATMDVSEQ